MVLELHVFLCGLDGYIYIQSMLVTYFNCMSHNVDFNACFFHGEFSANERSSDISKWFEWLRTSDSREIYVCRCLGKFSEKPDLVYLVKNTTFKVRIPPRPLTYCPKMPCAMVNSCVKYHYLRSKGNYVIVRKLWKLQQNLTEFLTQKLIGVFI